MRDLDALPIWPVTQREIDGRLQVNTLYVICLLLRAKGDTRTAQREIQQLFADFLELFFDLDQLSPAKEVDHQICLKEGTEPINVWPY